jgi:hypothetical protein
MRVNHQLLQPVLELQQELECLQRALAPALLGDLDQPMQVALVLRLLVQKPLEVQLGEALALQS